MSYQPLSAVPVTEEFLTGHEEEFPSGIPACYLVRAIYFRKQRLNLSFIGIQVLDPAASCVGVMIPIHLPRFFKFESSLELRQKVERWHYPSGKEVPAHPVASSFSFEGIGKHSVTENVNEETPSRIQPTGNPGHQLLIVTNMLKHLD
jgi:hypothetical protein